MCNTPCDLCCSPSRTSSSTVAFARDHRPLPFGLISMVRAIVTFSGTRWTQVLLSAWWLPPTSCARILCQTYLQQFVVYLYEGVCQRRFCPACGKLLLQTPSYRYTVGTVVQITPKANTRLSGLYTSGGMFCTQCEAEGFRRITFAQDRPDVMSTFSVRHRTCVVRMVHVAPPAPTFLRSCLLSVQR